MGEQDIEGMGSSLRVAPEQAQRISSYNAHVMALALVPVELSWASGPGPASEGGLVSRSHPLASAVFLSWHDMKLNHQNSDDTLMWGDYHSCRIHNEFRPLGYP